uniref:Lipoxygenase n=1 Tax=Glycine max TaxID=3847 RepID=A0A0R0IXL0_SOYBN
MHCSHNDARILDDLRSAGIGKGKVGKQTFLEGLVTSLPTLGAGQSAFNVHFEWDSDMGIPGAFYIENFKQVEFFLVSLTLEDIPNHGSIHFLCNSWVYNSKKYKSGRIFFANKTYLPSEKPGPLVKYREEELKTLRGDGTGERKEHERIYDYDVYNDLGDPDSNARLARPVLGGSTTLPYPRRGRTGRKKSRKDESFGHLKSSDFLVYILKSASQNVIPQLQSALSLQFNQPEFNSFYDVRGLDDGGIKLPTNTLSQLSPIPLFKELFRTDGEQALKFPTPKVIQVEQSAWMTDEEFAREMTAGVNPHIIKRLQSKLDSQLYGDNTSTITKQHLEPNLGGLTVEQDYPYAADGLEIWAAIKSWVQEYVSFYYKSDAAVAQDAELQAFWKELVEVGHGDKKNEPWRGKMKTRQELIDSCTILIWTASALHAAVNFGQYPYGGYILNRPTLSRRFMP